MLAPEPGTLIADKYRLEALLGEGGMGTVYRARHELMQKAVALKWLKTDLSDTAGSRERFMQEARAAARIRHPNVVDVYDIGVHEGGLFMVMELLEGASLAELLEQAELSLGTALDHVLEAMRGVAAAHAAGITHRDIKPENIFIAHDVHLGRGVANVLDFGISKLHDAPLTHLTQPGAALGTPHYMSFEQMQGARDLDHRTDIYSFGVLLYRVLTGVLPFDGETFTAIVVSCSGARPPSPRRLRPGIPQELDELVMKAIALRPEDRFASMDEMIRALAPLRANPKFLARLGQEPVPPLVRAADTERSLHTRAAAVVRPDAQERASNSGARAESGRRSLPASTTGAVSAVERAKHTRRIVAAAACVVALGLIVAAFVLTRVDKPTTPTVRSAPAPLPSPAAATSARPPELELERSTLTPTAPPPAQARPSLDATRLAPGAKPRKRTEPLPAAVPRNELPSNEPSSTTSKPAVGRASEQTPAVVPSSPPAQPQTTTPPAKKAESEHSHRSGHLGREDL